MSIEDLLDHVADAEIASEVCVVGAGAAGITIALELARSGIEVCLVESGGTDPDPAVDALGEVESVGLRRLPHTSTRARGVGGTTSLWTGRCGVLDPIDYAQRPWISLSGWPIDGDDLAPFVERASLVLGLGPSRYRGPVVDELVGPSPRRWDLQRFTQIAYQFSVHHSARSDAVQAPSPVDGDGDERPLASLHNAGAPRSKHVGEANAAALANERTLRVLTHAHVTEVLVDPAGTSAAGVRVSTMDGRQARISASRVVLCCGGVDTARLLLASRSVHTDGVGNHHDLVGRHLMDHPYTTVAAFHGDVGRELRRQLGHRWLDIAGVRQVYTTGLRLSPELQRREGLLNASACLVERGDDGAPLRRARTLVTTVRGSGWDRAAATEAAAIAGRPDRLAWNAYERFVLNRPSLAASDVVELNTVVEQLPDPLSRITLSNERDALGMPKAVIDWRAADLEYATTLRVAELLDAEIRRLGFEAPDRAAWIHAGADGWRAGMHDSSHPVGATRMSDDPSTGVVDRDCQVHGVEGLYVASGSVFPTSGHINPTLTIVSLAVRLADHLRTKARRVPAPRVVPTARRTRVALVGAGERISSIYLPVLEALQDQFEVVGFTARTAARRAEFAERTGLEPYPTAGALAQHAAPDLMIVAVSPEAVDETLPGFVELGVPLLLETPFAWDVRLGRRALAQIDRRALTVGVAEQTPFFPTEQLKRKVIELGLLGVVESVHNDFARYDYHATAAMRAYMGGGRQPARVNATQAGGALFGTITYDDGSTLLQHVGQPDGLRADDWSPSMRVEGPLGTIVDETLRLGPPNGSGATTTVQRRSEGGRLLELQWDVGGESVVWRNPFAAYVLSDEQIAVATLLVGMDRAVATNADPVYRACDALIDNDLRTAMQYSARRDGAAVSLPLRPAVERLRTVDARKVVATATERARTLAGR